MQGTLNLNLRLPVHTARASASGISTRHNPEFTSVEIYQAYADFSDMMTLTEEIVAGAAQEVRGSTTLEYQGTDIDLTPPWRRETMLDLVTAEMPDGVTFPAPGGSGGAAQLEEARASAAAAGVAPDLIAKCTSVGALLAVCFGLGGFGWREGGATVLVGAAVFVASRETTMRRPHVPVGAEGGEVV